MNGRWTVLALCVWWVLSCPVGVDRADACGCSGDPPGDPDCCWCEDGVWVCQCDGAPDCGTCWMCDNGCCLSCWCWDDGAAISGEIYVPATCEICQEPIRFCADVNDYDHWVSGWGYEQFPLDTIPYGDDGNYSWSVTPSVGVWDTNDGWSCRDWQAPPCIQSVEVRLVVDDKPDPAYNACYGHSDRNDTSKLFTASLQVVLPTGCREGEASVELVLNEIPPSIYCSPGDPDRCGYTLPVEPATGGYIDAVYHNCTWEFDIFMTWDVETGVCSTAIDISSGSDSDLTQDNYCDIVDSMKNVAGCACIGSQNYTSYECAGIHEAYHMDGFRQYIDDPEDGQEVQLLEKLPIIPVNCADPNTTTCQAVEAKYMDQLQAEAEAAMRQAYNFMHREGEYGAVDAARPCFEALAGQICSHAQSQSWPACSACP